MTAPTYIEPYTVRLVIEGRLADPVEVTANLLTGVAERCHQAGASLIGHIKCHGRTAAGNFHCSLTSVRSGAQCSCLSVDAEPLGRLDLDLAILVYGLEFQALDKLTRATVDALCETEGITWAIRPSAGHEHADHPLRPAEPVP